MGKNKKNKRILPILDFEVKPDPRKDWYYRVKVFEDVEGFQKEYVRSGVSENRAREAGASTTAYLEPEGKEIGLILMYKGNLTVNLVSHESAHAAMGFMPYKGIYALATEHIGLADAEVFCYAVGDITQQIWERVKDVL